MNVGNAITDAIQGIRPQGRLGGVRRALGANIPNRAGMRNVVGRSAIAQTMRANRPTRAGLGNVAGVLGGAAQDMGSRYPGAVMGGALVAGGMPLGWAAAGAYGIHRRRSSARNGLQGRSSGGMM